jgi:hypothetical protein
MGQDAIPIGSMAATISEVLIVVIEDAPGSPVEIVILFRFERPQEGCEPRATENQGDRDEKEQRVHAALRIS